MFTMQAAFIIAVNAGVDVLTHAPFDADVGEPLTSTIAAKGIVSVPTLIAMRTMESMAKRLPTHGGEADYAHARATVSAFHRAGVLILAGTDSFQGPELPVSIPHGKALHDEFELLVDAGLTPVEALRSATILPADYFGLTDRGVIVPGRRADLVLIEGDPTQNITATRAIRGVWVAGVQVR